MQGDTVTPNETALDGQEVDEKPMWIRYRDRLATAQCGRIA
jgi:hypothetical protein